MGYSSLDYNKLYCTTHVPVQKGLVYNPIWEDKVFAPEHNIRTQYCILLYFAVAGFLSFLGLD